MVNLKSISDNYRYHKPTWEKNYEFHEHTLVRRSGLDKKKLLEIIELFKEYRILEEEGY
jgi:hypothetical protein